MASESLQLLNLSPIPELSEIELSTVLEQLSGVSDPNGEYTDRNVEDILREAEELIDKSNSKKNDAESFKCDNNEGVCDSNHNYNPSNHQVCGTAKLEDGESIDDVLNLSLCSEEDSKKTGNSESVQSNKNEMESSQTDLSSRSYKSLTNHIQSALDSLRECSKKIEDQTRNSPKKILPSSEELSSNKDITSGEENLKTCNHEVFSEETEKVSADSKYSRLIKITKRTGAGLNEKQMQEKCKAVKKPVKSLSLSESMKTLDCFERLYRGSQAKTKLDSKLLKTSEKITKDKKVGSTKIVKTMNPSKYEPLHKQRVLKQDCINMSGKKCKPYVNKELYGKYSCVKGSGGNTNYVPDEDISFEKCLKLLEEDGPSQSSGTDITSFNYNDITEKILKQCTASVCALQEDVEDLKSQLKKNSDIELNWDPNFRHRFSSQENLIQILKEENSKLFKEIEEIKGQLRRGGAPNAGDVAVVNAKASEKVEIVEKLRLEVENLRRSLITAYSENNGILRLEEQFSLLKERYDQQIGKLEDENNKLKDALVEQKSRAGRGTGWQEMESVTKTETGIQTEEVRESGIVSKHKELIRSVSLENCRTVPYSRPSFSYSCENVDAATSPIRHPPNADKELCSVSVQCKGEFDVEEDYLKFGNKKREIFKEFHKSENKENVAHNNRKTTARVNAASGLSNPTLNPLKAKKISEHENQLMMTLRTLHSEVTVKDRENKKLKNEVEVLRNQVKKLSGGVNKQKTEVVRKCHVGSQTIGLTSKMQEAYDPAMFQVSRELENENEELKSRICELEKVVQEVKEKRVHDLQILQKLHEEEIGKLASRLHTQTALTNHLHSLLTSR